MKPAALAAIAVLLGACGTQDLPFDVGDARREACQSDGDCPLADLHCDPSSNQCVECVTSSQCVGPDFHVCDSALNQCVQCGVDGDCRAGFRCEPTTHRCLPSCFDGGVCPMGFVFCKQTTGACVECADTASCAGSRAGPVCDPSAGVCAQCASDGDCSNERPECDRATGRCVECLSAKDCKAWEACDPREHTCVDLRSYSHEAGASGYYDGATHP